MAVDITQDIPPEKILAELGDGDWDIQLPEIIPNIVVTRVWRERIQENVAERFVYWVMRGVYYEYHHRDDPPWDSSGSLDRHSADQTTLLNQHKTLGDWLENAFTGDWEATHTSGRGMDYWTYKTRVEIDIRSEVFKLFDSHVHAHFDFNNDYELNEDFDWYEDHSVGDAYEDALFSLRYLMIDWVGIPETATIWEDYEQIVLDKIADEKREAEIRSEQVKARKALTQTFWNHFFWQYKDIKIESPYFRSEKLDDYLKELLADAAPELVRAIADVGLPGHFSNSVKLNIKRIAKSALK